MAVSHGTQGGLPRATGSAMPGLKKQQKALTHVVDIDVPPLGMWFDRTLAALADIVLMLTPLVVAVLVAASAAPDTDRLALTSTLVGGILAAAGVIALQIWMEGELGQTPGKMILGLVTIDHREGLTVGFVRAASRTFVKFVLDIGLAGTGIRRMVSGENSRTRADEAAGTVVVYSARRAALKSTEA